MNILEFLKTKMNVIYVKYLNNDNIEEFPLYYVGGSQTLPPPLKSDEEEILLSRLANDDNEARKVLVEHNVYSYDVYENYIIIGFLKTNTLATITRIGNTIPLTIVLLETRFSLTAPMILSMFSPGLDLTSLTIYLVKLILFLLIKNNTKITTPIK